MYKECQICGVRTPNAESMAEHVKSHPALDEPKLIDRELAECAKINFENVERAVPQIKKHPFWIIAKAQLDESLGYGTVEDAIALSMVKP